MCDLPAPPQPETVRFSRGIYKKLTFKNNFSGWVSVDAGNEAQKSKNVFWVKDSLGDKYPYSMQKLDSSTDSSNLF